jgi:uncharacterized protein YdeI (YjbR/CyaY-like superfamily)
MGEGNASPCSYTCGPSKRREIAMMDDMETVANLAVLFCASSAEWEDWLGAYHAQPQGVWLKIAKKGAGVSSVSRSDALDVALCYGWIDGQGKPYDDQFWLQKFTPRRPKSTRSQVNRERVAQLIESGRMTPAGLKEVDAAKQDGRWAAAYASQSKMPVPDDLQAALENNPAAKVFFETLNKVNRYAICYRIESAKKLETRKARIDKVIAMLANSEKPYP